ncbi:MAG: lipid-binding SYLF domain-containing protein [Fretibacterium sp.]|nr:lipid-binding SYLF domain-containing protein [Fretibacterium sp.]
MNMRRILCGLLAVVLPLLTPGGASAVTSAQTIISGAISVVEKASAQKDADGMADTLRGAYAVAIVPSMFKAGFLVGGEYGEGLLLRRQDGKWYGPSFYNLGGGSFGLQIGATEISLLMAVINQKGVKAFLSSKTKLGGEFTVAAGPLGRSAEAATDAQAKASIYSYSMSRGLFAGVSLDGSVISVSVKRNEEYWKKKVSAKDALNIPAADKRIQPLLKALDSLIKKSKKK